ncbi:TPA: hypothetical protein N0F65_009764 [Lagenidium giganteum]|uniref:Uncharacterized protein n=1 Tax=Lagenidium giganteum TaxID=4803 RepID=A0AAV2YUX0_9STRA|nr:TPA: hypothetical protein N0F65_009764 [Lagenidium giganteum]
MTSPSPPPPLPPAPPPPPPAIQLPADAAADASAATHATAQSSTSQATSAAATSATTHATANLSFNPLVAFQTVLATELVPTKQRLRAAQQLEAYLQQLPTAQANVYLSFEPYLGMAVEAMAAPGKGAKELQDSMLAMLKALGAHNPRRTNSDSNGTGEQLWNERTIEFLEVDGALARVLQMWRLLLDHADQEDLVECIVFNLRMLLAVESAQFQSLLLRRFQAHFVDIADVLIGWAMNATTSRSVRYDLLRSLSRRRANPCANPRERVLQQRTSHFCAAPFAPVVG